MILRHASRMSVQEGRADQGDARAELPSDLSEVRHIGLISMIV